MRAANHQANSMHLYIAHEYKLCTLVYYPNIGVYLYEPHKGPKDGSCASIYVIYSLTQQLAVHVGLIRPLGQERGCSMERVSRRGIQCAGSARSVAIRTRLPVRTARYAQSTTRLEALDPHQGKTAMVMQPQSCYYSSHPTKPTC